MSLFAKPSEGQSATDEALLRRGELFDGIGRRRIIAPEDVGKDDPKLLGYTRATSYISALEDTTGLEKWHTRLILEGASDADLENSVLTAYQSFLEAERLAGIELKEYLATTPKPTKKRIAEISETPGKAYRARLGEIAEYAFYLGGGRESADYGTALHELFDRRLNDTLTSKFMESEEEKWPGILDDLAALCNEWDRFVKLTGAKVEHSEVLVVNDKLQVAGRTDLVVVCRLPGEPRSRRIIIDLKSGKMDSETKMAQQLAMYAGSKRYDPETGERSSMRVRQDIGIIIHCPKGEARAEFHVLQLAPGRACNTLCAKVRESRRKVPGLRTTLDLTDPS